MVGEFQGHAVMSASREIPSPVGELLRWRLRRRRRARRRSEVQGNIRFRGGHRQIQHRMSALFLHNPGGKFETAEIFIIAIDDFDMHKEIRALIGSQSQCYMMVYRTALKFRSILVKL